MCVYNDKFDTLIKLFKFHMLDENINSLNKRYNKECTNKKYTKNIL